MKSFIRETEVLYIFKKSNIKLNKKDFNFKVVSKKYNFKVEFNSIIKEYSYNCFLEEMKESKNFKIILDKSTQKIELIVNEFYYHRNIKVTKLV